MNPAETSAAFGAPVIGPRWTSSAKDGHGTADHTSSRLDRGELLPGHPWHYVRITPADPTGESTADPNTATTQVANGGGDHPARNSSAMPRCWAHAEYISLVRSADDSVGFDRIEPAYQRSVVNRTIHSHELWSCRHAIRRMSPGKTLRLFIDAEATTTWSIDGWAAHHHTAAAGLDALNLWFVDLATKDRTNGTAVEFTFFWKDAQRSEGRNCSVGLHG